MMTQMKERAVELIERIPDEKMFYVINILQNLEEMSSNRPADTGNGSTPECAEVQRKITRRF